MSISHVATSYRRQDAPNNFGLALHFELEGVIAGDVLVAFLAHRPRDNYAWQTPTGWSFLATTRTATTRFSVFYKIATSGDINDVRSFGFALGVTASSVEDVRLWGAVSAYRGVDTSGARVIQARVLAAEIDDQPQLIVSRPGCRLVYALANGFAEAIGAPDAMTVRSNAAGFLLADEQMADDTGALGSRPLAFLPDTELLHAFVAIAPAFDPIIDTEDPPPVFGAGAGIYIPDARDALNARVYRERDNVLIQSDEVLEPLSATLTFNAIGACVGGSALLLDNPEWQRWSRVVELYYNRHGFASNLLDLWYTGLVFEAERERSQYWDVFQLQIRGLDELFLQAPALSDGFPSIPSVVEASRNLNRGLKQEINPNTLEGLRPWRDVLTRRFEGVDNAAFGVGFDRTYVQGRPSDGTPAIIDAEVHALEQPTERRVEPESFVTMTYSPSNPAVIFERPDARLLIPRRISEGEDGAEGLIPPQGFFAPLGTQQSFELVVPGIAIPPLLITNLGDNRISQYASAAVVRQTASVDGSEALLTTTIVTEVLDYRRRDSRGRFI